VELTREIRSSQISRYLTLIEERQFWRWVNALSLNQHFLLEPQQHGFYHEKQNKSRGSKTFKSSASPSSSAASLNLNMRSNNDNDASSNLAYQPQQNASHSSSSRDSGMSQAGRNMAYEAMGSMEQVGNALAGAAIAPFRDEVRRFTFFQ
jgi:hypothetical protein